MADIDRFDLAVLYVEDQRDARQQVETILRRRVKTLISAENGLEGLQLFQLYKPELVVTDIRMPVLDGLEMVKEIRKISPDVKVIATTAYSDKAYLLGAIKAKVDHYVIKPLELKEFDAALSACYKEIDHLRAERKRHTDDEELLAMLKAELESRGRLHGIVPICSYCRAIRTEEDVWERVEVYISKRSSIEFSHSICPACLKEHHPDDFAYMQKKDSE